MTLLIIDVNDWDRCAPYVPVLQASRMSSIDLFSQLVLCNTTMPFKHHVLNTQLIVVVGAAVTPDLRNATTPQAAAPSTHSYYYSYYSYDDVFSDPTIYTASRAVPSFAAISKESESILFKPIQAQGKTTDPESTLHHCFELFAQRGNLDEENKWYCSRCQEHVCAENATRIDRLPETLVIQLERFEYTASATGFGGYSSYGGYGGYGSYGGRRKISSLISFPLHDLDMREWLNPQSCEQGEDCVYDLRAICNHSGSSSGGHYYCFACDENSGKEEWLEYNDSSVYPLDKSSLVRDTAYVLFYQRRSHKLRTDELIRCVERESALLKEKKGSVDVSMGKEGSVSVSTEEENVSMEKEGSASVEKEGSASVEKEGSVSMEKEGNGNMKEVQMEMEMPVSSDESDNLAMEEVLTTEKSKDMEVMAVEKREAQEEEDDLYRI